MDLQTTPEQSRTSARRLDRLIAVVLAFIIVALLVNRLVPGSSAVGFGTIFPQAVRHLWREHRCRTKAVVSLLGEMVILTRRRGKQAKDEVQPVPSLAAAGAIDMTATGPRIAVLPFSLTRAATQRRTIFATASRRTSSPDCHVSPSPRHLKQLELYLQEQVGDLRTM